MYYLLIAIILWILIFPFIVFFNSCYLFYRSYKLEELYKPVLIDVKRIESNPNHLPLIKKRLKDNFEKANKFYKKHKFSWNKEIKSKYTKINEATRKLLVWYKLKKVL